MILLLLFDYFLFTTLLGVLTNCKALCSIIKYKGKEAVIMFKSDELITFVDLFK